MFRTIPRRYDQYYRADITCADVKAQYLTLVYHVNLATTLALLSNTKILILLCLFKDLELKAQQLKGV